MWNFKQFSQNIALIDEDGAEYSYGELHSEGNKLAKMLDRRALVFNLCTNEKGSILGYTAFLNNGIVPVMLEAGLNFSLLSSLLKNYKPKYLWLPEYLSNMFEYERIYSTWGYVLLKLENHCEIKLYDELALLLTTSGSTGSPKLVRQSYKNIHSNTESIVEYLRLDMTECPITTLPMNYTYGLSIINSHLYVGAKIILTSKTLMQKEFWKQLKDYKATSIAGVPYTYEILDKLRFFQMELPYLQTITQAGGKLSTELHIKFAEYAKQNNKRFIVMYGQTEATARMSYLPHYKSLEKAGSIGIAIPGGLFSLIDEAGNTINDINTVGELIYRGNNVALGYAEKSEDLAKGNEFNGVLITGDMAEFDADGFYYIVGRKNRFLKIFGNRISLDEIERAIKTAFPNLDCACGGIDDKMTVFITVEDQKNNVELFLSKRTGLNRIAFNIVSISKIPRSEAGKVLYSNLGVSHDF